MRDAWRGDGVAKGDGILVGLGGVNATWCEAGARGRSGLWRYSNVAHQGRAGSRSLAAAFSAW